MEPIDGSETSAFRTQAPGNYPKENILHKEHGEILKSRSITTISKTTNTSTSSTSFTVLLPLFLPLILFAIVAAVTLVRQSL
jgi:hypothetical protein